MQEVITTKEHKYADRQRPIGERYQAEDKFLPAMQHLGWVEVYDPMRHDAPEEVGKRVAASAELRAAAAVRAPRTKLTTRRRRRK